MKCSIWMSAMASAAALEMDKAAIDLHMEELLHAHSEEAEGFRSDLQWIMPLFGHFPNFTHQEFLPTPNSFLERPRGGQRNRNRQQHRAVRRKPVSHKAPANRAPKEFNVHEICKAEMLPCKMRKSLIASYARKFKVTEEIDKLEGVDAPTKLMYEVFCLMIKR